MNSLVIPVYRNEESIPSLLQALTDLAASMPDALEVVFVVDGSPDRCHRLLSENLPQLPFSSQLLLLSRNFGSFAAIRCGLEVAKGEYFAVMAADLQEPPELASQSFEMLAQGNHDVVIGTRDSRDDPWASRIVSNAFWGLYRRLINPQIPAGGVDVFACNRAFRDQLLTLDESHSSLIGLIFWLGFRRGEIRYRRREREHGTSAWTLRRKIKYMMDSVFSFSDLPIRMLMMIGSIGIVVAVLLGLAVVIVRIGGGIAMPGYAATMIAILFFGGLNALGLGIIGAYVWRAFANTQRRPLAVVMQCQVYGPAASQAGMIK